MNKIISFAGVITDKNVLPVTRLNFGQTQLETSSGVHTLGQLVCTATFSGLPKSCQDLRLIGHTLNGFYSVMGSAKMESVYCDFTKLSGDEGNFSESLIKKINCTILIDEKVFKNGSDSPTSNQHPSISTSSEILIFSHVTLQLRSILRG
jgi:hypothetical protein